MADTETVAMPESGPVEIGMPDFEVKACIGEGAFGRVFLALSKATGRYRAVKVVCRSRFENDHPYDVEFAGLKRFEEVSREHEGFVDILHVTRDDAAGYFSYVMEVADDLESAQQIDATRYVPRTLAKELARRGRLAPAECIRVGLAMTAALEELHRRDLVHRDVNPRNIIFIRGAPKLADVGLVTEAHAHHRTLIGTPDYMDPEVHGMPAGDLYSFGKILYTMATGLHPRQWPELPTDWGKGPDSGVLRELEAIWQKSCQGDRRLRYPDASAVRMELLALQGGTSVLRLRRIEGALRWLRRYGLALLALLAAVAVGRYYQAQAQREAAELRQRKVGSFVANGEHALETKDLLGALSWFAEAWELDPRRENEMIHRIRLGSVLQQAPGLVQMWFQDRQIKETFFAGQENQILMSDAAGRWRIYHLDSGKPLYPPFGMGLPSEQVSLSRRSTAVTAAATNRVWLWDTQSGARLREIVREGTAVTRAAISPDGQWIATAETNTDSGASIFLFSTAREEAHPVALGQHPHGTHALVFSPNSRSFLSTGYDGQARVWEVEAGKCVSTFTNHQDVVFGGAFSPDSRLVVTAGFDRSARIWEAQTARELARFNHDDAVFAAEFSSDGTRLVTAGLDFKVRIWDLETQSLLQVIRHNSKPLNAVFSPQNKLLLTSCFDDVVRAWQIPKPTSATRIDGLIADGALRTITPTNGGWSVLDSSGSTAGVLEIPHDPGVRLWFAPDDRHFVATILVPGETAETRARLFDVVSAKALGPLFSVPSTWSNVVVSVGGRRVIAFSDAGSAVWDGASGQRITVLSNGWHQAAFSPDGSLLAVARSNQFEVWDLEQGFARLDKALHPTNALIGSMAWDPTSRRLLTACWNDTFTPLESQTWIARTGESAGPPLAHRDGVLFATFSHDGTRVITCGEDHAAILWDPTTGRRLAPPLRHHHQVLHAVFSADDRLVATAASDNNIAVWSADAGELLASLQLPPDVYDLQFSMAFSPGNRELVFRDGVRHSYRWILPFYDRPREDLMLHGQLLSAQQADSTESLTPHSKAALQVIWERLRSKYPQDYSISGE
jgi:WD40 repeat protein/serine/threonine protein kinase